MGGESKEWSVIPPKKKFWGVGEEKVSEKPRGVGGESKKWSVVPPKKKFWGEEMEKYLKYPIAE